MTNLLSQQADQFREFFPKIVIEHIAVATADDIESDHGKLKRLIKPTLGFKSLRTAYATIKGFEVMRMFKKGQMDM